MPRKREPKNKLPDGVGVPLTCPYDGASLDYRGLCELGRGYPGSMRCPFVCPHCRKRLGWDGGCAHCYGTTTGKRDEWNFPGDCYELRGNHWVFVCGPRMAVSQEDAEKLIQLFTRTEERGPAEPLQVQTVLAKYQDNPTPADGGVPF
jgi:hypothetical protein